MPSIIVTVLLVCVMLSIIVGFMVSALRLQRRHARILQAQAQTGALRISAVLPALNAMPPDAQQQTLPLALPASWFRRRRTLISIALLLMMLLTLFLQSGLADGAFHDIANGLGFDTSQHLAGFDINTSLPPIPFSASANVVR